MLGIITAGAEKVGSKMTAPPVASLRVRSEITATSPGKLGWKKPEFSGRRLQKTPNASYLCG
jgi:hypothetical protein